MIINAYHRKIFLILEMTLKLNMTKIPPDGAEVAGASVVSICTFIATNRISRSKIKWIRLLNKIIFDL